MYILRAATKYFFVSGLKGAHDFDFQLTCMFSIRQKFVSACYFIIVI